MIYFLCNRNLPDKLHKLQLHEGKKDNPNPDYPFYLKLYLLNSSAKALLFSESINAILAASLFLPKIRVEAKSAIKFFISINNLVIKVYPPAITQIQKHESIM